MSKSVLVMIAKDGIMASIANNCRTIGINDPDRGYPISNRIEGFITYRWMFTSGMGGVVYSTFPIYCRDVTNEAVLFNTLIEDILVQSTMQPIVGKKLIYTDSTGIITKEQADQNTGSHLEEWSDVIPCTLEDSYDFMYVDSYYTLAGI